MDYVKSREVGSLVAGFQEDGAQVNDGNGKPVVMAYAWDYIDGLMRLGEDDYDGGLWDGGSRFRRRLSDGGGGRSRITISVRRERVEVMFK